MASMQHTKAVNLIAGEDLRSSNSRGIYTLLLVENDSNVGKVVATTTLTATPIGILAEEPDGTNSTDGETVPVVLISAGGVGMVKAAGTITAGNLLVSGSNGGAVSGGADQAALANDAVSFGVALESAVANDVFEFVMQLQTSSATA